MPGNGLQSRYIPKEATLEVNSQIGVDKSPLGTLETTVMMDDKNLRSRKVIYEAPILSSAHRKMRVSEGTSDATIMMVDKKLRSRKVTYEAPTSPSAPRKVNVSEGTSDATIMKADKNLRSRKVTYEVPTSSFGCRKQQMSKGTSDASVKMVDRNLHSRAVTCEVTTSPSAYRKHNLSEGMSNATAVESGTSLSGQQNDPSLNVEVVKIPTSTTDGVQHPIYAGKNGSKDHKGETDRSEDQNMKVHDASLGGLEMEDGAKDTTSRVVKKRGPNRNLKLEMEVRKKRADAPKGEKYRPRVNIPEDEKKAVGEWSSYFARELGIIVKQKAPLRVKNWSDIPQEKKEEMWQHAAERFNLDVGKPHVRETVMNNMSNSYANWRSKNHDWYKALGGGEHARMNPPAHLVEKPEDWRWICDNIYDDEKWKARSSANSKNRRQLKFVHKLGSKSFAQRRHEMTNPKTNEKPGPIDFFDVAYKNRKGWAAPAAELISMEMRDKQLQVNSESGLQKSEQDIVNETFSRKTGIIVAQSRPAKQQIRVQSSNTINQGREDGLQRTIDEQKAELLAFQARIDTQQTEIERQRVELDQTKTQIDFLFQHCAKQLLSNQNAPLP